MSALAIGCRLGLAAWLLLGVQMVPSAAVAAAAPCDGPILMEFELRHDAGHVGHRRKPVRGGWTARGQSGPEHDPSRKPRPRWRPRRRSLRDRCHRSHRRGALRKGGPRRQRHRQQRGRLPGGQHGSGHDPAVRSRDQALERPGRPACRRRDRARAQSAQRQGLGRGCGLLGQRRGIRRGDRRDQAGAADPFALGLVRGPHEQGDMAPRRPDGRGGRAGRRRGRRRARCPGRGRFRLLRRSDRRQRFLCAAQRRFGNRSRVRGEGREAQHEARGRRRPRRIHPDRGQCGRRRVRFTRPRRRRRLRRRARFRWRGRGAHIRCGSADRERRHLPLRQSQAERVRSGRLQVDARHPPRARRGEPAPRPHRRRPSRLLHQRSEVRTLSKAACPRGR